MMRVLRRLLGMAKPPTEQLKLRGHITLELRDATTGRLKTRRHMHNLIVTAGKNWLAEYLTAASPPANMSHIAIGTGTTDAQVTDTALQAEIGTRVAATKSRQNNVGTWQATFAAGNGTGAITEAGLFNAAAAGTMFSRRVFAVINKSDNDELVITWQITFG